jgi:hypothetical protein
MKATLFKTAQTGFYAYLDTHSPGQCVTLYPNYDSLSLFIDLLTGETAKMIF